MRSVNDLYLRECLTAGNKFRHLLYQMEEPPKLSHLLKRKTSDDIAFGRSGKQATYLHKLRKCLSKTAEPDRKLIMVIAQKMAGGRNRRVSAEA